LLDPQNSASCLFCHRVSTAVPANIVGTPTPYIGPFSGNNLAGGSILGATNLAASSGSNLHKAHPAFNAQIVCMDCHNLSVHFNSVMQGRRTLNSGFAAASVGGPGTKVTSYTYNSPISSSCSAIIVGCHPNDAPGSTRSWFTTVIP
jgi:hypothetical protein